MKNRALFTLFIVVFIDLLGFGLVLPLLPFIGEKFGANPFQIGLLSASYSFFQFISSPILGRLSDRFGRKKLLIISQAGSAIGYLILGLANNIPLLFLARIIDGITGGNISIAQAYIADVTDKKNRARGMGIIGAAFGMGFIFGPAIGGLLAQKGFLYPALFATAASTLTVILNFLFLKETVTQSPNLNKSRSVSKFPNFNFSIFSFPLNLIIFVFLIINLAFTLFQANFALWTQKTFGFGPTQNGWLYTFVGILIVTMQLVILPFLLKNIKEKTLMKTGILFLGLGIFLIIFIEFPALLFVPMFFIATGNGMSMPTLQAVASENVDPKDYGEILGVLQSAGSLGRIIGPVLGGEMFLIWGKNTPFLSAGILMFLITSLLFWKLK